MEAPAEVQRFLNEISQDKATLYVICPSNIGDIMINGGLCHALLKKKRKKVCVLIAKDRFESAGFNFIGVLETRCVTPEFMNAIREYVHTTGEYEGDNYIYGHFHKHPTLNGYIMSSGTIVKRYKKDVFDLPLETELLPPFIDSPSDSQIQLLNSNYVLDKERTIILMPYANSIINLEMSFWEQLATKLTEKNKDRVIYTNVSNPKEKVIPSTAPMVTTFQELIYLAEKVKCFIGLRSGIFDLLAFTNAKLLYIMRPRMLCFDLKLNFNHANSRAFYLEIPEPADVQAWLKQHSNLPAANVFFDEESLRENILASVD